jgi:hypothetical protein
VCLNDFEKEKDSWELSREEKLSRAQELKAKAGDLFNTGILLRLYLLKKIYFFIF